MCMSRHVSHLNNAQLTFVDRSHVKYELTNRKKLVKKSARIVCQLGWQLLSFTYANFSLSCEGRSKNNSRNRDFISFRVRSRFERTYTRSLVLSTSWLPWKDLVAGHTGDVIGSITKPQNKLQNNNWQTRFVHTANHTAPYTSCYITSVNLFHWSFIFPPWIVRPLRVKSSFHRKLVA